MAKNVLVMCSENLCKGLGKKLGAVLSFAVRRNQEVLYWQEIGDFCPALLQDTAHAYGYHAMVSPARSGGVALLVPLSWKAALLGWQVIETGRALAATFQHQDGVRRFYATVYLPTGLDFIAEPADLSCPSSLTSARSTMNKVIAAARGFAEAFIAGDFNCTADLEDRSVPLARIPPSASIHDSLVMGGFVDSFKHLHPGAAGYTFSTPGATGLAGDPGSSRLDFIYCRKELVPNLDSFHIMPTKLSDHKKVSLSVRTCVPSIPAVATVRPRLPNIRRATSAQQAAFGASVASLVASHQGWFARKSAVGDSASVNLVYTGISELCLLAAQSLPWSGGSSKERPRYQWLDQRIKSLCKLRQAARAMAVSVLQPDISYSVGFDRFTAAYMRTRKLMFIEWPESIHEWPDWLYDLSMLIGQWRKSRRQVASVTRRAVPQSLPAKFHYMLREERPNGFHSLIDPVNGALSSDPVRVKELLRDKFAKVFACPPEEKRPKPSWVDSFYQPDPGIDPRIYDGLMRDFTDAEVSSLAKDSKLVVAPGHDGVSAGLLKVATSLCPSFVSLLTSAFNAVLRLEDMPAMAKISVICPIPKKSSGDNVRELSNVRPISLQPASSKLLMKGLARRLGPILVQNHVLHPAQEAYLPGGSSFNCVDTLIDVWETAKSEKKACFNTFYDLRGAYDTVQQADLTRALRRIRCPEPFIRLIAGSMSNLISFIRTVYGNSAAFKVLRSIRQGFPLAPLLFAIFVDPWHVGLAKNPIFEGAVDGFEVKPGVIISSKGFADDTWATSSSLQGMIRLNAWTHAFCEENHLSINGLKTQLAAVLANGKRYTNADGAIVVGGQVISPVAIDDPIFYIGVWLALSLSWKREIAHLGSKIGLHCHLALRHRLSVQQATSFFNMFLSSKLEYGLRHCVVPDKVSRRWDSSICRILSTLAGSNLIACKSNAIARLTGLILPSQHSASLRISEAFFRINSDKQIASTALARLQSGAPIGCNRMAGSVALATKCNVEISPISRARGWIDLPAGTPPLGVVVPIAVSGSDARASESIYFGFLGTWGSERGHGHITVFAAAVVERLQSAWALVYPATGAAGATTIKSSLSSVQHLSALSASLEAVAHAVFSCPLSLSITVIVSTSHAGAAIQKFRQLISQRKKLRTHCHAILSLLCRKIDRHVASGSKVVVSSIRPDEDDGPSIAEATVAASDTINSAFVRHRIDWSCGEKAFKALALPSNQLILGDLRGYMQKHFAVVNFTRWSTSPSQSLFACKEVEKFFKFISKNGSRLETNFCLRVCTNSVQHANIADSENGSYLVFCRLCFLPNQPATVCHLLRCSPNAFLCRLLLVEIGRLSPAGLEWHQDIFPDGAFPPLSLASFLPVLFSTPSSSGPVDLRLQFGAWSQLEQRAAIVRTGIEDAAFWSTWRLRLFRSLFKEYRLRLPVDAFSS